MNGVTPLFAPLLITIPAPTAPIRTVAELPLEDIEASEKLNGMETPSDPLVPTVPASGNSLELVQSPKQLSQSKIEIITVKGLQTDLLIVDNAKVVTDNRFIAVLRANKHQIPKGIVVIAWLVLVAWLIVTISKVRSLPEGSPEKDERLLNWGIYAVVVYAFTGIVCSKPRLNRITCCARNAVSSQPDQQQ